MAANRIRRVVTIGLAGLALLLVPIGPAAAAPATATLSVWIDGWGSGTVTSSPPGINCHLTSPAGYPYSSTTDQTLIGPCDATFPVGTVVTTTATPAPDSSLNGSECGGSWMENPCRKTVRSGYNAVWVMFCPRDGMCSAG
jgi:hypothetical protein